jgi:hypothetical protein
MPPRIDPYSNKTHKRIDLLLLVVITLVLMIFAFRASAQYRQNSAEPTRAGHTQSTTHK